MADEPVRMCRAGVDRRSIGIFTLAVVLTSLSQAQPAPVRDTLRSEERRGGKECRSRGAPCH